MKFHFLLLFGVLCLGSASAQKQVKSRIAVLACLREKREAPALLHYLNAKPDLCLWIGDNVYGDTYDKGIEALQACYDTLSSKPGFAELRGSIPYMVGWDDHDFGKNDGGSDYPLKQQSKQVFRSFWKLENRIPEDRDGIYDAQIFNYGKHTLQVIILDVRYNRDKIGSNGAVLGENQWIWLEKELNKPSDLRIIVSGFQLLLDKKSGSETWDQFPNERQRLFDLIKLKALKGVVFLTGDQHYAEVCRARNTLGYDAIELQFAGINQTEEPEFNSFRVSKVATALHSAAYLDIVWEENEFDKPHLLFSVWDTERNVLELEYRVNFYELGYTSPELGKSSKR